MAKNDNSISPVWLVVTLIALLIVVPILYALSIGPVALYYDDVGIPDWVNTFYAPLYWLRDHSETASHCYFWYLNFWVNAHPPVVG